MNDFNGKFIIYVDYHYNFIDALFKYIVALLAHLLLWQDRYLIFCSRALDHLWPAHRDGAAEHPCESHVLFVGCCYHLPLILSLHWNKQIPKPGTLTYILRKPYTHKQNEYPAKYI